MEEISLSPMKTCSNPECAKTLPLDQFFRDRHAKDGYQSRCKVCRGKETHAYYVDHAEELCAYAKGWRLAHHDLVRAQNAHSYAKRKAKRGAFVKKSREERLASQRRSNRVYAKAHPDIICAISSKKRAVKRSAPINDFTAAQWISMKELCGYRCVYCGKKKQRLTQDHVTPLSKGGSHTWDNIVPACQSCNSRKWTKAPLKPVQGLLNIM